MPSQNIAKEIFYDALEASLPKNFISKYCTLDENILTVCEDNYDLRYYKNIYVFGSGKAAFTMAQEIEFLLEDIIHDGLIVAPYTEETLDCIEVCEGAHPLPCQKSFDAAQKLIDKMQLCDEDDLYIYLLSGGSSSMIELPVYPINLEDFQNATQLMLHNSLEIQEINTIRKHISQIKGGRLAQVSKAEGIVLVISDIIDNDLYSIGSGPLYGDKSTYSDAKDILDSKNIFHLMPENVQEVLERGLNGNIGETPKSNKNNVKHYIIASNDLALNRAAKSAKSKGLSVKIFEKPMIGNVDEMVQSILRVVEDSSEKCILFGGECTVKVTGNGQGGRNQHTVALMLKEICNRDLDICFLSAGTDGIDGNSDAAGAVINQDSCKNLDLIHVQKYIDNFDSYNLFKQIQSLIMTGPSGTNIIDIAIVIKGD